jgi:transcriptional regulator with PAS, ATPase and Fis domain
VTIGSDASADIVLDDETVSGLHVEIEPTDAGLVIRDLSSRNGTFVDGTRIVEAVLGSGATIGVGQTRIRFDGVDTNEVRREVMRFGSAVGASPSMQDVYGMLDRLAPAEVSIMLIGETGTGKDVFARAIHRRGPRAEGPLVVFDCGAVASNLIESELFGHERGAFTGAVADRPGAFERADGGTLFLDEIGELPLDLQPRLLRALEQREVRRVGGNEFIGVNVRVVAATNRELEDEVEAGRFRRDLFFRLNAAVIRIPPLRDRLDDLPSLAGTILADMGMHVQIEPATLGVLQSYEWPGNVRELKNVLASAAAFVDGPRLEPRHLIFFRPTKRAPTIERLPLGGRTLETLERAAIKQTLEKEGGNKTRAAKSLGIASSTLYEKIKKYKL